MTEIKEKLNQKFEELDIIEDLRRVHGNGAKVITTNEFLEEVNMSLSENGFKKENSRLVFSVCPDDVNRLNEIENIENALTKQYNGEFHLGGLGAYPMGGVSGIIAASHHPPDDMSNGNRKHGSLIFFISPHMGIIKKSDKFIYGKIIRPGQEKITSSCGAMMGFLSQLKQDSSPENYNIAHDLSNVDPTRIVLHNELINNYSKELEDILAIGDENKQVLELFNLNYDIVANKGKEMIKHFLEKEKEHFKGEIAFIGGITVNTPSMDYFIMKEITYPIIN